MSEPVNVILAGAPGSGKGTQSKLLIERRGLAQISTGDILRAAVSAKTALGLKAQTFMDKGALVPDELIMGLIEERIGTPDYAKGFILDGFPRTLAQAQGLSTMLDKTKQKIKRVIVLDVDEAIVFERIVGRRTCERCGHIHHLKFSPPKVAGVCDRCGGALVQRKDDAEEKVNERLEAFRAVKTYVIPYYASQNLVTRIDGLQPPEAVYSQIEAALK